MRSCFVGRSRFLELKTTLQEKYRNFRKISRRQIKGLGKALLKRVIGVETVS